MPGIIVPMAMYRKYGDVRILEENYEMMKNWYAFLESRAENNAIQSGIDYGEWCEPGTNPMMSMQNGNFDVATAYFAHSGETLSEIAAILGKEEMRHITVKYQKTPRKHLRKSLRKTAW